MEKRSGTTFAFTAEMVTRVGALRELEIEALACRAEHAEKRVADRKHCISDNVDSVKQLLSVLIRALRRARYFALVEDVHIQPRLARNHCRSGTQSDPCISSVTLSIMITTSNSPVKRERDTHSIARCSIAHHSDVRAVPRANRTFSTARNPMPCASSSTFGRLTCGPSRPSQSSAHAASSGGSTYCAIPGGCVPSLAPLPPAGSATVRCLVW